MSSKIEELEQKCQQNGITIWDAVRAAGMPEATVTNWRKKNPKSFEIYDKIDSAIDKLAEEKKLGCKS